ncbi:MAG TPA: hypothetical protein VHN14_37590 [Kofleriaceae bacterium]|jgi:hypothetical protein|nr:hypothetical protein [Kofleriaceae bacterium]
MDTVSIHSETRGSYEEAERSNSRNTQSKLARPQFRIACDALLATLLEDGNRRHAQAMARLAEPDVLRRFFIRSTIENVRRIELMRKINPLVCVKAAAIDPILYKKWGLYAADEGLHSRMFARDLHTLGIGDDVIYATPPLFSTELLCGYLYHTLEEEGPMAVVASGYYVESMARLSQPGWLDRIESVLGTGATRGSRAHLLRDAEDEHIDLAWNLGMRLVTTSDDERRFVDHVHKLHALLAAYVGEVLAIVLGEGGGASATTADLVRAIGAARSAP